MPNLTLSEAAKLSQAAYLEGVIKTIVKDSVIFERLPIIERTGDRGVLMPESKCP